MKYYIVDDEIGVVKTLDNIIKTRLGGTVEGYETDPNEARDEILKIKPDVLLVDFLMAETDGITLVKQLRPQLPQTSFIMISKVSDKAMVEQAYQSGIEFFINKPINLIEIESVLKNVEERRKASDLISNIKGMFHSQETVEDKREPEINLENIRYLLTMLGMNGEKGTSDILELCALLLKDGKEYSKEELEKTARKLGDTSKNVEQHIRRAIKKGLSNAANAGIEDFSGEVFQVYASYVFDFTCLKDEMNYRKGLTQTGGRANIGKFINGLLFYNDAVKR